MEFPSCIVTASPIPGCRFKALFCCCGQPNGMIATPCLCSGPALLAARFPERPTCWFSVQGWQVSLSVSSSQRRMLGGVRGWISSCHCWLRASCFLFSNLYINTVHLISFINQKRQPAGCAGSRSGLMTGYEWMYAYARREMFLRLIYCYYGLGG